MLRLPPFEYLAPKTLADAVSMMSDHGPQAMYVSGGTDLYPNMKRRQFEPKALIGLRGSAGVHGGSTGGGLGSGGGLTLSQVSTHPQIIEKYPALARAAGLVSSPPLRNMGSIGGHLCIDHSWTPSPQTHPC